MSKKVLVTGGAGFIGRELAKKLVDRGYHAVCFDLHEQYVRHREFFRRLRDSGRATIVVGTILDRICIEKALRGCDAAFHLAAMLGVRRTEEDKLGCLNINIDGSANVFGACVSAGVDRIVFASSSEVYGEPGRNPIRETDETKGKTVYAVSKLAGEELLLGHYQMYPHLRPTIVRFFNTYGEGQVAQFVIARFVKQVLEGKNPTVYGDGTQKRSYGHVDDVTDGLLALLESDVAVGNTYNLGNSNEVYTLRELAQRVIDLLAPDKGLTVDVMGDFEGSDRSSEREVFTRYCDTSRAAADFGYAPRITVDEGIRRIAGSGMIHADWPTADFA
ncbi:MAG: NAD-dependent epimerase/dehydratase family protein [Acetobacterales bacterium]